MDDEGKGRVGRKHFVDTILLGGAGGVLSWLFGLAVGSDVRVHPWVDPLVCIALGAGASVIFVFLVANTDRSDAARLYALGLLAGFFWQPVYEGGRALIDRHTQQSAIDDAKNAAIEASALMESYKAAKPAEQEVIAANLNESLSRLDSLAKNVDSVAARQEIGSVAAPLLAANEGLPESVNRTRLALARSLGANRPVHDYPQIQLLASRDGPWVDWDAGNWTAGPSAMSYDNEEPKGYLPIGMLLAPPPDSTVALELLEKILGDGRGGSQVWPEKLDGGTLPPPDQVRELNIGDELSIEVGAASSAEYLRLNVPADGKIVVRTRPTLAIGIYNAESLERVEHGLGLEGGLRVMLKAGNYWVRICALFGKLGPFTVSAVKDDSSEAAVTVPR